MFPRFFPLNCGVAAASIMAATIPMNLRFALSATKLRTKMFVTLHSKFSLIKPTFDLNEPSLVYKISRQRFWIRFSNTL